MAFVLGVIALRLALEFGYFVYVSPLHAYAGFTLDFNLIKYSESWILMGLALWLVPTKMLRPSDFIIALGFFGLIVPVLSLYGLANLGQWIIYSVLFQFVLLCIFRAGPRLSLPTVPGGPTAAMVLLFGSAISLTAWYVASGGLNTLNFDFTRVYEFREEAGAVTAPGILGYINTWVWTVTGPLLLTIALWRRWWLIAVFVIASQVFWFAVTSHKAVLFYPLIVIAAWFWFQRSRGLSVIPLGFAVIAVASSCLYLITSDQQAASLFVRRSFYVIAYNTFDYFHFFSENPKVWWSTSNLTLGLMDPIYDGSPAKVIGVWRDTLSHANNSFLSLSYAHAGIIGMVLYPLIAGLLLRLVDSAAYGPLPTWVALGAIVVPCRALMLSADLPTAFLTEGIAVGILMLILLKPRSSEAGFTATRLDTATGRPP